MTALRHAIVQTRKRCLAIEADALTSAPTVAAQAPVAAYLGGAMKHETFVEMKRLFDSDQLHPPERLVLLVVSMTSATHTALAVLINEYDRDPTQSYLELWLCELQRSLVYAQSLLNLGESMFEQDDDPAENAKGHPAMPSPFDARPRPRNRDMN
jgi:hypothetical protein